MASIWSLQLGMNDAKRKPSILFVYFTYTKQTLKVVDAMSEFETFPMPHPFVEVL
jgi:hypothetical protein